MSEPRTISDLLDQLEQRNAAGDWPACIAICRNLLERIDRERMPDLWAAIQGILADNLRADPVNGPEQAIGHYEQALEIFTEETHAVQWAAYHGNLGNIFLDRRQGNRRANLKQAIAHFRAALRVFAGQPRSADLAATHASLGEAFAELGGHADKVIHHYGSALPGLSKATQPNTWLKAHLALGQAYFKTRNMDQALPHLQKAISLLPAGNHRQYGYLNEMLGHCWRGSERGPTEQGQELTIQAFEAALDAYQAGRVAEGVTRVRAQLGECYAHRIRGERAANVHQAIDHLETVLEGTSPADPSWAVVNAALGQLYDDPALQ